MQLYFEMVLKCILYQSELYSVTTTVKNDTWSTCRKNLILSKMVTVRLRLHRQATESDVVMLSAEILQAAASTGVDKCYEHVSLQFLLPCSLS